MKLVMRFTAHHRHAFHPGKATRPATLALCTAFALLFSGPASAGNDRQNDIEARYQRERAACDRSQDRTACLREAAAARDAAQHGQLDQAQPDYERNALARCDALPQAERDACRRRARGEGEMRGSVSGGGIYREYKEITLPGNPPPPPPGGRQNK
ncbi:MAG TPA: hypothetical protein VJ652_07480 [Noviherbaspirillum sp.]|nr:hypothetical protein [Noviherbaspirillum sp.]